ncbi:MAG: hypothetical protein AB7E32_16960 [Desulfovibrio sp.]
MSEKTTECRFTWNELVSAFGIVNSDELTEREKAYLLSNMNSWVCQFGRAYVTERRSLFLSNICGPNPKVRMQ